MNITAAGQHPGTYVKIYLPIYVQATANSMSGNFWKICIAFFKVFITTFKVLLLLQFASKLIYM